MKSTPTPSRFALLARLFPLLLAGFLSSRLAFAQMPERYPLAKGVDLIQEIVPDTRPDGPLAITMIEIDLKQKGVRVAVALGQDRVWGTDPTFGREIVSTLAARHQATAAINGGFFPFQGNPLGLHIQDGEMVTEPLLNRSCLLLFENRSAQIAAFSYSGALSAGATPEAPQVKIDGMNRRPAKKEEMILYTPLFFDKTPKAVGRVEIVLSGIPGPLRPNQSYQGTVAAVQTGGETPLSPGTVVLSASGTALDFIKQYASPGQALTFRLSVNGLDSGPIDFTQVEQAIAGGPRLLTDGKITVADTAEGFPASFSLTRHPRTAVGITEKGALLLAVVDGRQKGVSRGVSLTELATILLKYGVRNAVNLDGGGSSTAVVRDIIVNSPSDGKERAVANALLVYTPRNAKTKESDVAHTLTAPPAPLLPGERFVFEVAPKPVRGIWGVSGGIGFVSQTGIFTAVRPGTGTVFFLPEGIRSPLTLSVTVAAPAKPLPPQPKAEPGEPDE